jgi:hypothetical protein
MVAPLLFTVRSSSEHVSSFWANERHDRVKGRSGKVAARRFLLILARSVEGAGGGSCGWWGMLRVRCGLSSRSRGGGQLRLRLSRSSRGTMGRLCCTAWGGRCWSRNWVVRQGSAGVVYGDAGCSACLGFPLSAENIMMDVYHQDFRDSIVAEHGGRSWS